MDHAPSHLAAMLIAVALLVVIGTLAAFSYHTTAQLDATLNAAGINPQSLHPGQPVPPPHG